MANARMSRSIPLPSLGTWVIMAATVTAIVWVWHVRQAEVQSPISPGNREATDVLSHMQDMEAAADEGPAALPELIRELDNSNPRKRCNALLALRRLCPDAGAALERVRELLADDTPRVRARAIETFMSIRRGPDETVPLAVTLLLDEDQLVRDAARKVLQTIGPTVATAIVPLLQGDRAEGRLAGLQLLREIGWDPALTAVEDAVRNLLAEPFAHEAALAALVDQGEPTTAELRELLQQKFYPGKSPTVSAFEVITRRGPAAINNLPDLLEILSDPNHGHFWSAMAALRAMGPAAAKEAAPELFRVFEASQEKERAKLAWTLYELGVAPQDLVPRLIPMLDEPGYIPFHAGRIIAVADPDEARRQVARLIPRIRHEQQAAGQVALQEALFGLAPVAEAAIPALCQWAEKDPANEYRTVQILSSMGPKAAPGLPILRRILARPLLLPRENGDHELDFRSDIWKRIAAAKTVANIGPGARAALPDVFACLDWQVWRKPLVPKNMDTESYLYETLLAAVASIGDGGPEIPARLRRLLHEHAPQLHAGVLLALVILTPDSPEVVNDFNHWLGTTESEGREEIILAICKLQTDRRTLIPRLVDELRGHLTIRKAAVWTLGDLGAEAKSALPALRETESDGKEPGKIPKRIRDRRYRWHYSEIEQARWDLSQGSIRRQFREPRLYEMTLEELAQAAIAAIEP
jgi:HEAT repeat protein